jgi:hypothetical protein
MSRCGIKGTGSGLRRRLGWKVWAVASTGLIILACAETSSGPSNSPPDARSNNSPGSAIRVPGNQLEFIPVTDSHVELQGMTTVGSWGSRSSDIHAQIVLDTDAKTLKELFDHIQSVRPGEDQGGQAILPTFTGRSAPVGDISVPVKSLHGDSSAMDRDMQNALKAAQYPSIEYVFHYLQQSALQWDPRNHQASLNLRMLGTLTMAGVGRPIAMDVIVRRDSRGNFIAHAQTALLMTDFGVTPPGALFDLIKAEDRVVVVFDLVLVLVDHSPGPGLPAPALDALGR